MALLETKGDYEFADKITAFLSELIEEIKKFNDREEKATASNTLYKQVEAARAQQRKDDSENWDITWANIVDSIVNTDSDDNTAYPRFDVGQNDEILCKTKDDANCIADFLKALGFDVCTSEDEEHNAKYRWEIHPNGD